MTAPAPSGGPSPLRIGGIALLGIGVIAAVVGIGSLVTGGGDGSGSTAAPAPTTAPAPVPPPLITTSAPATGTAPSVAPAPAGGTPTNPIAAAPDAAGAAGAAAGGSGGAGSAGAGSGSGGAGSGGAGTAGTGGGASAGSVGGSGSGGSGSGGATVVKAPVRVYNNSTVTGLAARAADEFRRDGWTVEAVANYPYGTIPTSTVYYRPGTAEQQAAQAMGNGFGLRVEQRFVGLDDASPGLIVIVTNDYQKR